MVIVVMVMVAKIAHFPITSYSSGNSCASCCIMKFSSTSSGSVASETFSVQNTKYKQQRRAIIL